MYQDFAMPLGLACNLEGDVAQNKLDVFMQFTMKKTQDFISGAMFVSYQNMHCF